MRPLRQNVGGDSRGSRPVGLLPYGAGSRGFGRIGLQSRSPMMKRPWRAHVPIATWLMLSVALPASAANEPACSRYTLNGLTIGMNYKTVQRTVKRDGLVTNIRSTGRGEA